MKHFTSSMKTDLFKYRNTKANIHAYSNGDDLKNTKHVKQTGANQHSVCIQFLAGPCLTADTSIRNAS